MIPKELSDSKSDTLKRMLEMALESGNKRRSKQTGYIHHHYDINEQEPYVSIPIVENFLYVLALFRSRIAENIIEAKTLLDGLLHFQNTQSGSLGYGNFPLYIHEFPVCKDRFLGVQVGMAIFWILKHFHQILGSDLKKRLESSLNILIAHILKAYSEKPSSYSTAVAIAALSKEGGMLIKNVEYIRQGEELLEALCKHPDLLAWHCPASLGTILAALTMAYSKPSQSPWKDFWKHIESTWHQSTGCFIGPAIKVWQKSSEPKTTLYDLFLGYLSGVLPARVQLDSIMHLQAVLIPSFEDCLAPVDYPLQLEGNIGQARWLLYQDENIAYSFIERDTLPLNPADEKGFHPLFVVWGNLERAHTLVCQGGNIGSINMMAMDKTLDLAVNLGPMPEEEDREKSHELEFFLDAHEGLEFLVSEHKSSTFLLGETLSLQSGICKMLLNFTLEVGEGRFLGHRMLGNRPSQMNAKGNRRFNAYDWQIFLRTVRRSEACKIRISLKILTDPHPMNA